MMIPGLSMSLIHPLWMASVLPVLGVLLYVYRRKGRGNRVVVSTVYLLKKVARKPTGKTTPKIPPRFFFELLVLFLVILALAGLSTSSPPQHSAVLIDNSLSMSARVDDGTAARTVFERAIEHARQRIASYDSDTVVSLFLSAPQLTNLTEQGGVSPRKAFTLLESIEYQFSEDSIQQQIQELQNTARFQHIEVFTDYLPAEGTLENPLRTQVFDHRIEEELDNVALTDVLLESPRDQDVAFQVKVEISSFAGQHLPVRVSLQNISSDGTRSELDHTSFTLRSGQRTVVPFTRTREVEALAVLLEVEKGWQSDRIEDDNFAWITPRDLSSDKIVIVSERTEQKLGLDAFVGFPISRLSPDQYLARNSKDRPASVYIYDRFVPSGHREVNALYNLPEKSAPGFRVGPLKQNALLTSWSDAHPVLSYLRPGNLRLPRVIPLEGDSWTEAVLRSSEGVIGVAGEQGDKKFVAFGFDLFPFSGSESPRASILLLNSLSWLKGGTVSSGYEPLGPGFARPDTADTSRVLIGPKRKAIGQLQVNTPGIRQMSNGELAAYNFFSDSESNIRVRRTVSITKDPLLSEIPDESGQDLSFELALLTLGLLLLDMIYTILRQLRIQRRQGSYA